MSNGMSDSDKIPHTPIPLDDWAAITRNISKMSTTIVRIDSAVSTIKNDLLPPVAEAAKKAEDGVIRLEEKQKVNQQRLKSLEVSDHDGPCEVVLAHSEAISSHDQAIAGLSKWRWWIMGSIVTAVIIAGGWAVSSSNDLTAVRTEARSHTETLKRHDASILSLEKQRQRDLERIVESVNAVPEKVRNAAPQPSVGSVLFEEQLTPREIQTVHAILERARMRGERDD